LRVPLPLAKFLTTILQEVDESKQGANFVGLTWVESEGKHFLLAANFSGNKIEMFDGNFKRVQLSREAFDDDRHGLFGTFTPVAAQLNAEDHE